MSADDTATENADGNGFFGDPDLDEVMDRMSVFGNNPVADACKQMMQLLPPVPAAAVDEDEDISVASDNDGDASLSTFGGTVLGIGIALAAAGAGVLIWNEVKDYV